MRVLGAVLVIAAVSFAACDTPTTPSGVATRTPSPQTGPSPPPLPTGSHSLTGTITERTPAGDRPLAAASVNAWVQIGTVGYSYWYANGPRTTDAQGRYELTRLPTGATLQLEVYKEGYLQQCAAPQLVVDADLQLDAQLVARTNVSASIASVPPSSPGLRLISGVLYEVTSQGRRATPNTFVYYEPFPDSPAAITSTDAEGRFLLCGIPTTRTATISAALGARSAYVSVPPGSDANVEIEMR